MKLSEAFCVAIFTVAVAASSVLAENESKELSKDKEKRISKREAILIDSIPIETNYPQSPKVIYKRVSRHRYVKPKTKHAPPRPRYGPPKRRPVKKYRGKQIKPKYNSHVVKKRPQKPTYGPPKPPKRKPIYGPPKKEKYQSSYVPQEPVGFGEPPMDFNDYQPHNSYEPPTDSYGAPLKPNLVHNEYPDAGYSYDQPAAASFNHGHEYFTNHHQQTYQNQWQKDKGFSYNDNAYAHSQKYINKAKPLAFSGPPYKDEQSEDYTDEEDTYNEYYNHRPYVKEVKKPHMYEHSFVNRPRYPKTTTNDPMIVGGQYAEPPPKIMPNYHQSYAGDEYAGAKGFADSETAGSIGVSSYVNYKNSNMAFSPQNLNDAFSIID